MKIRFGTASGQRWTLKWRTATSKNMGGKISKLILIIYDNIRTFWCILQHLLTFNMHRCRCPKIDIETWRECMGNKWLWLKTLFFLLVACITHQAICNDFWDLLGTLGLAVKECRNIFWRCAWTIWGVEFHMMTLSWTDPKTHFVV